MTTTTVTGNNIETLLQTCRTYPIRLCCDEHNIFITYEHGLYYVVVDEYPYPQTYGPYDDETIKLYLAKKIAEYIYTYEIGNHWIVVSPDGMCQHYNNRNIAVKSIQQLKKITPDSKYILIEACNPEVY